MVHYDYIHAWLDTQAAVCMQCGTDCSALQQYFKGVELIGISWCYSHTYTCVHAFSRPYTLQADTSLHVRG
jgi:hypothetical protein